MYMHLSCLTIDDQEQYKAIISYIEIFLIFLHLLLNHTCFVNISIILTRHVDLVLKLFTVTIFKILNPMRYFNCNMKSSFHEDHYLLKQNSMG